MTSLWGWLADVALASLLTVTLVMAFRLDRALRVIRRDRVAFETLISNLGAATASVKSGIQTLRSEAERAAEQIERRTMEADKMATDLSFLAESADRASARLEQTLRSALAMPHMDDPTTAPAPATDAGHANPFRHPDITSPPAPTEAPDARKEVPHARNPHETRLVTPTSWPKNDGRIAGATAETDSTTSPDLREMAGITTRRARRFDDAEGRAGTDASPASIRQTG